MLDYKRESNGYTTHGCLGQFTKALLFTTLRSRLMMQWLDSISVFKKSDVASPAHRRPACPSP
jgi:hypothetical protein